MRPTKIDLQALPKLSAKFRVVRPRKLWKMMNVTANSV